MIETPAYAAFVRRTLRAYGRRVAAGDEVDLAEMVAMREELEKAISAAVAGQRTHQPWSYIAKGLGTTRQAAQQRYAEVVQSEGRRSSGSGFSPVAGGAHVASARR